jgi:hypothetical protein
VSGELREWKSVRLSCDNLRSNEFAPFFEEKAMFAKLLRIFLYCATFVVWALLVEMSSHVKTFPLLDALIISVVVWGGFIVVFIACLQIKTIGKKRQSDYICANCGGEWMWSEIPTEPCRDFPICPNCRTTSLKQRSVV